MLGVVGTVHLSLVMDDGSPVLDGIVLVEDGREHFVFDFDEAEGLFGDLDGVGGNRGHPVADVAHLVVEAHLVVGERVGVALAAGCVADSWHVPMMQDGFDTGQCERLRIVDDE